MLFTNSERFNFAKDPAVVRFCGKYFLYYTILYSRDADKIKIGVGIAVSDDMENWSYAGDIPLEDTCEKNGIGAPAAIVLDGKVHVFYQTYGNGRLDAICHAVSDDGYKFLKNPENPIYRPTADWCSGRAIDADVCIFKGKLFLYFATRDRAMKIQKVGGAYAALDSGFTKDSWTDIAKQSLLAPEFEWEGECIEAPATVVNDGKMFMFYGGAYNCSPQQIGYAVSDDGEFFKKGSAEPFIRCGSPGAWNSSESGHPYAFRDDGGRVYLFYQGSSDNGNSWYISRAEIGFTDENRPYVIRFFED